jgi:hypothetical protein
LARVAQLFLRPAMLGWTLKAFSVTVLCMVPLAVVSAYAVVPKAFRSGLFIGAGLVMAVAYGLFRIGKRLREP